MQRITISLDDPLAAAFDEFLQKTGYQSRSEGVRDLVREAMGRNANEQVVHAISVANLSYIYNRRVRLLASRLSDMQHAHHNLIASTTLIHLDHDFSLESVMLKGSTQLVRDFADKVRTERGVLSVMLNLVGVEAGDLHEHDHDHFHTGQKHLSPTVS
jgi:CopG family nickel-responsive transcriptional regulator